MKKRKKTKINSNHSVLLIHRHTKNEKLLLPLLSISRSLYSVLHPILYLHACLFLFACLLFLLFFLPFLFFLVRSFVRCVGKILHCNKYLSRRRATLMRKKSKKPIDYLSLCFSWSLSFSLFSQSDYLLTVRLHNTNITTITDDNKRK